jgi:flagellar hook-basal body complex protein FliE
MSRINRVDAIEPDRFSGISRHKHQSSSYEQRKDAKNDQDFDNMLHSAIKDLCGKLPNGRN